MIESLNISNFQSHQETKFNFVDGLNVIVGSSDSGKSSIFRALNWICFNKPTGNSFRSNFTKEDTKTVLTLDGHTITRTKGKSKNFYNIDNDSENLQALRTDLPDEVKQLTKIDNVNLQPQSENFFLLNESPGKVAKKFNEIAGLEVMDKSLHNINSKIRESKQDLKSVDADLSNLKEKITDLNWIHSCNKKYTKIEEQELDVNILEDVLKRIKKVIIDYDDIEEEIEELPSSDALPQIENILNIDDDIYNCQGKLDTIEKFILSHSNTEERLNRLTPLDKAKLPNTSDYIASMKELNNQASKISNLIQNYDKMDKQYSVCSTQFNSFERKLEKFKQINKFCPTCGESWK